MWHREYDAVANIDIDELWSLWSNPERWPEWNLGIAAAELSGPFEVGTTGRSRAPQGPARS